MFKQGHYLVYVYIIYTLKTITDKIIQKLADKLTIKLTGKLSLSSKPNIKLIKSKHKLVFSFVEKMNFSCYFYLLIRKPSVQTIGKVNK